MARTRPPNRRQTETYVIEWSGHAYDISISRVDGTPVELFVRSQKTGSQMDALLDDICIMLSLLLQYGHKPADLARTMGQHSLVGTLVKELQS